MIVNEEFIRCDSCGGADFEKKEVVTIPKISKKRPEHLRSTELPILDKKIEYYCCFCNKKLDR